MSDSKYSDLFSNALLADDTLTIKPEESWMQGRTIYGGLTAAICLYTALQTHPNLPPLRSGFVNFIGPASGGLSCRCEKLREGKSVTFIQSRLHGENGLSTSCDYSFGAARQSKISKIYVPRPSVKSPHECVNITELVRLDGFFNNFDTRLAEGAYPGTGSDVYDNFYWVRHKDEGATDVVSLIAAADVVPPAIMSIQKGFARLSSMTWGFNLVQEQPFTKEGWWLMRSRAESAKNGYSSQDMWVWNSEYELIMTGRQNVAIFF